MLKKSPRIGEDAGKSPSFRYLVDLALHGALRLELASGMPATKLLDELSYVLSDVGFYQSYWGATEGIASIQDNFLGLAIERGLLLYTSFQLELRNRTPISSKRLNLGNKQGRCLLDCALALPKSDSFDEPDVSAMVKYLLVNGCDANDLSEGQIPLSRFLQRLSEDDNCKDAAAMTSTCSYRIKTLKILLTHGADPNFVAGKGSWSIWTIFLQRLYERTMMPKHLSQYFLDIMELLLSFGADPNLPAKGVCRCCPIFTPWRHFLNWGGKLKGFNAISLHQQEFLAQLCKLLLEHGADPAIKFPQPVTPFSTTKDFEIVVYPPLSVADIVRRGFPARLSAPILATLPLQVRAKVECDGTAIRSPQSNLRPETTERHSAVSVWNPFSWWSYLRSVQLPSAPTTKDSVNDTEAEEAHLGEETYISDRGVASLRSMGFKCSSSKLPKSFLLAVQNRFSGADITQRYRTVMMHDNWPIFLVGPYMFPGVIRGLIMELAAHSLNWNDSRNSLRGVAENMTPAKLESYQMHAMRNAPWAALVPNNSSYVKETVTGMLFFAPTTLSHEVRNFVMNSSRDAFETVEIESLEGKKHTVTAYVFLYSGPMVNLVPLKEELWDSTRMLTGKQMKPLFDRVREEEQELRDG